jgi:uncharacterized RDD family membrane protein YckC
MRTADRYINDVMRTVFAASADKERLEADLRAHFSEAEAKGELVGQTIDGLGTPEEVAAALTAERQVRYAGFWQRLVAFVGDCGLLLALAVPPLSLAVFANLRLASPGTLSKGWTIVIAAMALAVAGIAIFYFPLLEARFGKTLGKHLLRIRVIRESGAPISLGQAFVRRLSLYFDVLMLDALFIPFTQKRQRALDIVAQTIVAREPGEKTQWWGYAVCLLLPAASALTLVGLVLLCAQAQGG